jgi:hypothetical protein
LFITFLVAAATVFALLEIQIEGAAGWARSLPTWRIDNRWTRWLFGARAVTGYHVYFQLFLFVVLHLPYGLGLVPPSVGAELRIVAFLLLFWVVEDFLWFVFNPAFGIRGFRRERIPWHAETWWWFMPRDYWIFVPAAIGAYVASWAV